MSDAFWTGLFQMLPVLIPAVMAAYMTWRNGQRARKDREDIKATVCDVAAGVKQAVAEQVIATDTIVQHAAAAGERRGFVGGIEVGKKQASQPAALATDFDPLDTGGKA